MDSARERTLLIWFLFSPNSRYRTWCQPKRTMSSVVKKPRRRRPRAMWNALAPRMIALSTSKNATVSPAAPRAGRIDSGTFSTVTSLRRVGVMAEPSEPRVALYTRPGCHLCGPARQIVRSLCAELDVDWVERPIADDRELTVDYGELIPVVTVDGVQQGFWRIDEVRLRAALARDVPALGQGS